LYGAAGALPAGADARVDPDDPAALGADPGTAPAVAGAPAAVWAAVSCGEPEPVAPGADAVPAGAALPRGLEPGAPPAAVAPVLGSPATEPLVVASAAF
jgi:hypothetical protein